MPTGPILARAKPCPNKGRASARVTLSCKFGKLQNAQVNPMSREVGIALAAPLWLGDNGRICLSSLAVLSIILLLFLKGRHVRIAAPLKQRLENRRTGTGRAFWRAHVQDLLLLASASAATTAKLQQQLAFDIVSDVQSHVGQTCSTRSPRASVSVRLRSEKERGSSITRKSFA